MEMVFCGAFSNLPGRSDIEDDDSPLIEQSRFLTSIKKFNKNDGRADDTTIQHLMEKCREKTATSDPHLGREIGLVIADLAIAERNNNKNNDSNSNIKKFTPSKINASSKKGTGNGADGNFWHAALQQQEEVMQLQYEHIQQQLDHQRKEIYKSQTMPRQHHHHDASGTNSNTSDSSPSASIRKRGLQEVGKFLPSSSTSTFHHIHLHNNNNPIHNQNQNQAIISNRHQQDFDHPQNSHNPSIHNHHLSNIPPPNRNNTFNHQPHQPQQQHHQRQYTHKLQIQKELHKQQQMQQKSKFCPLCSCLLTYLYQNSHTGHLTEIHGGPDTPTTKESNSIPPYCIGCRAYLLFDWLDEDQRQLLLDNLAKQLEDGLDCDDDDDDDDDGQEGRDDSTTEGRGRGPFDSNGMGNAKIVVVGITSPIHSSQDHDLEEEAEDEEDALEHSKRVFQIATIPRHSNSMDSNSSSTAQSEKKFLFDHMNNAPFASDLSSITNPRFPMQSSRVPSQPYRRKGDVMFEARDFQEDGAHADLTVETVPQKDINDDDQYDQGTISTTNVSPQHKMHGSNDKKPQARSNDVDNLIRDANTNYNDDRHDQETVSTRNTSPRHKQHHGSNVGHESTCHDNSEDDPFSNIEGRDNKQDDVGEDVNEDGNSDKGEELDNNAFEGPFEGPDVAVPSKSFQSCSRCQSCGSQDQSTRDIRLISTNSEERVILQRYSMKKDAATKSISKRLKKKFELTTSICDRCEMPMMSKNGKIVCVVCPVIKKKAKRIAEKKRSLKPTKPNQQHYGGIPRQSKQYLTSDDQPEDVRDEISVAETKMELPYGKQNQSLLGGNRMKGSETMTMFDEANNLRDMEEGMFNNCVGGENVVGTVGSATTVSTNHDPRNEKEICPRSSWPYMKDKCAVYNSNISHQSFPSSVGHEPAASIHSDYWVRHSSSQSKTDIGPQSKSIQCYSDLDHRSTHQLHVGVEHAHRSHQHDASQQHPYHEHVGSAFGGSMVSGIENHQNQQTVIQQHPSYDHLNVRVEMSQSHHSQSVYGSPIILDTQSHSNQQTTIQQHSSYEHPGITVERSHSHNSQSAYSGSVVSDTQCPRNIPSGEMIWHYKASGVTNQLESTFPIQSGNSYHGHHVHAIDAMDGQKETCYNYSQNNDFLPELVEDTMNAKYDCFSQPMGVDRQGNESSLGPVPSEMHQHDHKSHPRQATSRPIEFHKNEIQSHKADLSCQMKNDVIQEKSLHQQHFFPLKGRANSLSINTSRSYENEEICKVEMEGKDNRKDAKGPNYKDEQASRVDVVDGLPDTQGGDNVKLSDTALYDELNANASKKGIPSPSSIVNNRDYLDLQGHSRTPRQQISDNPENSTCNSDELESRGKNGFSVPIARPGGLQELDCHKCSVLPIHAKDVSSQSVTGCDIKQGRDVNGLVGQANRPSQGSFNVQYEGPSGKNEAITNTNQRITSQSHRVETKDAHTQAQVERKDAKIQANMSPSPALSEPLKVDHDDFKLPRISHMQGNDDFRCDQNPLSDELNEISIKRQSPSQLNIKRDGENYYLDSHPQSSASEEKDNVKDRIYGAPNDRLGQNSYDLLCSDQAQTRAAQENECHDLVPITPKHKNSCHMRTVNTNLSLSNATPLSSGKSHCDTVCKERKDSMQQDHRNIHSLELPQQKYVQPSKHFQDTALYPPPSSPLVRDYADIRLPDNHQRSSEGENCIDNILPNDLEKHHVSNSNQPRGSFNQEGRPTSKELGNQASCFIEEISRKNFDVSLLQQFGQYDSRKIEIPAAMCVEDKQVHLVTDGHTLDENNSIQIKMLRLKSKLTSLKNQMTPKSMHMSEILNGKGNNVEELPAEVMPFNTSSRGKMNQLELESHPYNSSWKRSQPNNETGNYENGNTEYHHAYERQHNRKFHFQREHCDKILPSSPTLIVLNDRCDSPSYLSEMEHAERYRPDPTPSHLNYRHCSDFVDHDIHGKRHAESTRRHGHDPPGEKMIMRHRREKDDHRHRPKGDLGNNHPRRKPKNKHHRPDPRAYFDDKLSHFNQTKYPSESIKNDLSKQTPKSKQKNVTSRGGKRQNKSSHDEKSSSKREQSHGTIHHLVETTTESSFDQRNNVHLSIPSWVDDEIDAPLQHAKSEDSMDQILRRIDEIENDFDTIVASLPGSKDDPSFCLRNSKSEDTRSTTGYRKTSSGMNTSHIGLDSVATHSFESNASEEEGMVTDILHRIRSVQDYIEHMDSVDEDNGYADGYDSQGEMSTLIQRLANAAESLRTL